MKQAQQEVNEILSSIRKMISEEETMASHINSSSDSSLSSESVLNLTKMVQEDGSVVQLTATPQEAVSDLSKTSTPQFSQNIPSSLASSYETTSFEHSRSPETESSTSMAPLHSHSFSLESEHPQMDVKSDYTASSPEFLSHDTLRESAAAFEALTQATQRQSTVNHSSPTTETVGQYTVDALMRDLLKPLLKDWLDAHLPSLVRALVLEQIEKVLQQKTK